MDERLVIRFDGPPGPTAGRFIEVELGGKSVSYGEWEQDGDDWLLVLPDADAKVAQLEAELKNTQSNWKLADKRAKELEADVQRLKEYAQKLVKSLEDK